MNEEFLLKVQDSNLLESIVYRDTYEEFEFCSSMFKRICDTFNPITIIS